MNPSSLDNLYMEVAKILATPGLISKDPDYVVGACIVDPRKNVIVSSGANHFPYGCEDKFLWKQGDGLDNKNLYVVHAEANAIIKRSSDVEGCILYTTLSPCNECAKLIIQSKIEKVFYLDDKPNKIEMQAGRMLLQQAGIPLICLLP